jgi:hypothetical protein
MLRTTLIAALLLPAVAGAQPLPGTPGRPNEWVTVPDGCPTFAWSPTEGAVAYELIVLRATEVTEDPLPEPVLRGNSPAGLTMWTPTLAECLQPGAAYAWAVRSRHGEAWSEWSEPLLFRVPAGPTEADVARALATLRAYPAKSAAADPLEPSYDDGPSAPGPSPAVSAGPVPTPPGNPTAHLTVEGEVRTIDSTGAPRLWGHGRPGTTVYPQVVSHEYCQEGSIQFGLSHSMVEWGAAAEACPAGTWVCAFDEIGECNTERPDSTIDAINCDGSGSDFSADSHLGWVADASDIPFAGLARVESAGDSISGVVCLTLPVWCCWSGLAVHPVLPALNR